MEKIDFVVTWVDGNDKNWIEEKEKYSANKSADASKYRYRDMGHLKYWFRAVDKYAPWVNKVHFVTCGHIPPWLNTSCDKLNIVKHSDYIPEQYLPTFNSHPIEIHMHRIKGLAEKFIYFNDDVFLNAPVSPEFFYNDDMPCDFAYLQNIRMSWYEDTYAHVQFNVVNNICEKFFFRRCFLKNFSKYVNCKYPIKQNIKNLLKLENNGEFTGFVDPHLAIVCLKKHYEEVWELYSETLEHTSSHKFRTPFDVGPTLFRNYRLAKGEFSPVSYESRGKYFRLNANVDEIKSAILNEDYKQICLNDTTFECDYEHVKEVILSAFERKLPQKSQYEI